MSSISVLNFDFLSGKASQILACKVSRGGSMMLFIVLCRPQQQQRHELGCKLQKGPSVVNRKADWCGKILEEIEHRMDNITNTL